MTGYSYSRSPVHQALAGAPGVAESEYEILGHDSRVRVKSTTVVPFRYICNLVYDFPRLGRWAMGTGTLIGPRTVLTAAHCVYDSDRREPRGARRLRAIPARNGRHEPFRSSRAFRVVIPNKYRHKAETGSPHDYALIHLEDPLGLRVGYWSIDYRRGPHDSRGTKIGVQEPLLGNKDLLVHLSGYPADKPGSPRYGCRASHRPGFECRHSLLGSPDRSTLCGTYQYRSFNRSVRLRHRILHYLNDTCPGHSGSPVWVRLPPEKGGRVLIAVHVDRDDPEIPGKANKGVLIDDRIIRFIRSNYE